MSLVPITVAAGFDATLDARVDLNLTLGFDFNATDQTEAQFLATPLSDLNGATGVDTIAGDDIDVVLPNDTFTFNDIAGHPFGLTETVDAAATACTGRRWIFRLAVER